MKRFCGWLFNRLALGSLVMFTASAIYFLVILRLESQPRGIQIETTIPSDADEILVINFSSVEHWEYTPWDNKWYFMSGGPVITCALAVLPLAWVGRVWLNKLRAPVWTAECMNCGYDLRATPDRCPECGTIPPKK